MPYMTGESLSSLTTKIVGAAVYGGVKNYIGVQEAAKVIAAASAGSGATPTAQQIAQAESQVLATKEPVQVSTYLPAAGAAAGLALKYLGGYVRAPWAGAVGDAWIISAASDAGETITGDVRRSLRKVTASSTPGFVGGVRARPGQARGNLVAPLNPPQNTNVVPFRYTNEGVA